MMGPRVKRITPSGEAAPTEPASTAPGPVPPQQFDDQQADAPAGPPAKLTKLQAAMGKVSDSITAIQKIGADIEELERTGGPQVVFEVATKAGKKQADEVRAKARKLRLDVQDMRKEATSLLNGLKNETWAVTDPTINKLQAIEDNAKGQLEAEERKERDRKERHAQNMAAIAGYGQSLDLLTSDEVEQRLNALRAIIVDDSYEEFQAQAQAQRESVLATLQAALTAALAREQEQEEAAERERERAAIKLKIDNMKLIPDQVQGTDLENVRRILASLKNNPPTAAEFGDQLELAELVHFKVVAELTREEELLVIESTAPSDEEQDAAPEAASENPAPGAVFQDEPSADPFTAPVVTPAPTAAPARRPVPRTVIVPNIATPHGGEPQRIAVTLPADPRAGLDMTESDVPDLLAAAKDFIAKAELEGGFDFFPAPLDEAYAAIKAAVAFIDEFAD
jgi:hypothetical protein